MEIDIQRRAKIALRSLQQNEQKQILKALKKIESVEEKHLWKLPGLKKLSNLGQNLYLYRGNHQLRLVISVRDNICIVEDIIAHDKLDKLVAKLKP